VGLVPPLTKTSRSLALKSNKKRKKPSLGVCKQLAIDSYGFRDRNVPFRLLVAAALTGRENPNEVW
jgi:hypothetical protein